MILKRLNKGLFASFFAMLCIAGLSISVKAAARTEVYLQRGESYSQTYSKVNKPVIYKFGDDDKKVVDVTVTATKLTIKTKATGSATLYICKDGKKADSSIIRTIKVHVYADSQTITPTLSNNISHAINEDRYYNTAVKCYKNLGFNITASASSLPTSVGNDTSGKAKGLLATAIYECKNTNGDNLVSGDTWRLAPNALSGNTRYFKGNVVGNTYIRGCMSWTSSAGKQHWTKLRVIYVSVYNQPVLSVFEDGKAINTLNCVLGESRYTTFSVAGLGASDVIDEAFCEPQDSSKADIVEENGAFVVTPKSVTNNGVYLTYKASLYQPWITPYNNDSYTTVTKKVLLNVGKLSAPVIKNAISVSGGIKISYDFIRGASSYNIYRANTLNGEYEEVGKTSENYYIDTSSEYDKTYYYKVTSLGKDGEYESEKSASISGIRKVVKPTISKVKKVDGGLYQLTITSGKATGYEIYKNNNLILISKDKAATFNLSNGTYTFKVKAYVTVNGKKHYSDFSDNYKFSITSSGIISNPDTSAPAKVKIKKVKKKKKSSKVKIKIKKVVNAKGYQIAIYRSKKNANKKHRAIVKKTLRKNKAAFTIKSKKLKGKKKVYVRIRAYILVGKAKLYGKWSKVK